MVERPGFLEEEVNILNSDLILKFNDAIII